MIVGSPSAFAIESLITEAYENPGFRALGYFVLHLGGESYGIREPDASMLACSFDVVEARIAHRGEHVAPFSGELDAGAIADGFRDAVYAPVPEGNQFFGMSHPEFSRWFQESKLVWAPDGDEAFDDASFVLQFDVDDHVRLIGFRSGDGYHHDPETLRDVWLPANTFYGILRQWRDAFIDEWRSMPKVP